MITIKAEGESVDQKIKFCIDRISEYVRNRASFAREDVGIGSYEYWGQSGKDSSFVTYYDDESEFKVELGQIHDKNVIEDPTEWWEYEKTIGIYVGEHDIDVYFVPKVVNGELYYFLKEG